MMLHEVAERAVNEDDPKAVIVRREWWPKSMWVEIDKDMFFDRGAWGGHLKLVVNDVVEMYSPTVAELCFDDWEMVRVA